MRKEGLMSDLADEITAEADVSFQGGRTNNLSDLGCSIGAIIASFLAAVLAAVSGAPGWVTAIIAALPGLCNSLQRVVDFRGRSAWYFVKAAKLRDLALTVKWDPNLPPKEAARQFGGILKEMEDRWSELVRTGAPPPIKSPSPAAAPPGRGV
jgi:hypothetical protein